MNKRYTRLRICEICKNEKIVAKQSKGKLCKSCSNKKNQIGKIGRRLSLVGQKFGKLTVSSFHSMHKKGQCLWLCVCECGKETVLLGTTLKRGVTKSCGCIVKTQKGLANTSTYNIWHSMVARCHNKNSISYPRYGGRGIKVCDRWKNSFLNFLEDMGERPEKKSIDRIDNNENYCKENCRWSTSIDQSKNTRRNNYLEAFGKKMIIGDWAKELGIQSATIRKRIRRGLSLEDSLITKRYSRWDK